jgi:S1-C subfamily serine protease
VPLFAAGLFAVLVSLLLYREFAPKPLPLTTREVNEAIDQALADVTPAPALSMQVFQAVQPSLVFIKTEVEDAEEGEGVGVGSGVVINQRGDILTSLHVVEGASAIEVIFADGSKSSAQIIASQPGKDIAVLQATEALGLIVPAVLGNPNAMRVGDEAFVVGNPFGLYSSMSAGVISGFDRTLRPEDGKRKLEGLIQIDAAVNPGNSGGPLLNRSGQVIGIVTALANPIEQEFFVGIGFAVPIDAAGGAAGLPPY